MKILFRSLLVFGFLITGILYAQSDKKAEELLENVVNKTASYENLKAEIAYTMVNHEMDIDEKKSGIIYLKGDSYRIEMEGQIIISDGITIWTFIVDSDEVMVSNVEEGDESISPNKILTTYNEDYKAKFDSDNKYKNSDLKLITIHDIGDLGPHTKYQIVIPINPSEKIVENNKVILNFLCLDKDGFRAFYSKVIHVKKILSEK